MAEAAPEAGWYADPDSAGMLRYWDGAAWTSHRQPLLGPERPLDLKWLRWGTASIGALSGVLAVAAWRVVAGPSLGPGWLNLVQGFPHWAFGFARLQSFAAAVLIATTLLVLAVNRAKSRRPLWSRQVSWTVGITLVAAVLAVFWTNASWADYVSLEMNPDRFVRFAGLRSRDDFIIASVLYSASCIAATWAFLAARDAIARGSDSEFQQEA